MAMMYLEHDFFSSVFVGCSAPCDCFNLCDIVKAAVCTPYDCQLLPLQVIYTTSKQESFTILVTPKNFPKVLHSLEVRSVLSREMLIRVTLDLEDLTNAALSALQLSL